MSAVEADEVPGPCHLSKKIFFLEVLRSLINLQPKLVLTFERRISMKNLITHIT